MTLKQLRPIVKGLTWRVVAAVDTLLITAVVMWWHTGEITSAVFAVVGGIVGMELLTKTTLYAFHEKFWEIRLLRRIFK